MKNIRLWTIRPRNYWQQMLQYVPLQGSIDHKLPLITTNRVIPSIGKNLIWESPIYRFVIEGELDGNDERTYKEIIIDVTASVPSFDKPSGPLSQVFDRVLDLFPKRKPLILDFGAGKLRNTLYFLEKGYEVCAVEFEKTSQVTDTAKTMYETAQTFGGKFHKLIFPHEFLRSK